MNKAIVATDNMIPKNAAILFPLFSNIPAIPIKSAAQSMANAANSMNGRIIIPNNAPKPGPASRANAIDKARKMIAAMTIGISAISSDNKPSFPFFLSIFSISQ